MDKKGGEAGSTDRLSLKKAVKKRISYLQKKPHIEASEAYNLIKGFFKALNNKDYEYTREELVSELDEVYLEEHLKEKITDIILELGQIEFADVEIPPEKIKEMLEVFSGSMDEMVHSETVKKSFWDHFAILFSKKSKKKKKKGRKRQPEHEKTLMETFIEEVEKNPEETPEPKPTLDSVVDPVPEESPGHKPRDPVSFKGLYKEFMETVDEDQEKALQIYEQMKEEYEFMEDEGKQVAYESLIEAYKKLME